MNSVPDIFGSLVFNNDVMREKLPKDTYKSLKKTIADGRDLDINVANTVANAMKDWALEKGATHFTHWFQPMTGVTAEKHDSFLTPIGEGHVIMDFSGKELIKGEPDASSFPSGGLRSTFEARGYTAWDPTSFAFIKDGSLCIPSVFCSFGGEALDKKTPLLRSMEDINEQALRILRLFGNTTTKHVDVTVGAEQEYFLIDKKLYQQRKDLMYCGRTLFGATPPKGQELDDHYFGAIKPRIAAYMKELDEELWKLGILSKTKHNEVAPAQHELAPLFTTTNLATDNNQLTMEIMRKVADRHDLVCLLHEKPFAHINGSGKHNNWSLSTADGANLLEPGKLPHENAQFLLFLAAVIKAVDENQDLMRISVASAGNDHRLGANEAPPAIFSVFLGDELTSILESIEYGTDYGASEKQFIQIGIHVLPDFPRDNTDRNRTSPFAFTGNKFEFRSLGSSMSISGPNIVLNTIVAEALKQFADELENTDNFTEALNKLIARTIKAHKRVIFNGDGYSDDWKDEAERRGLLNLKTTVDALPHFTDKKNIDLFTSHKTFTEAEMNSREEILLETYSKNINIEGLTLVEIVRKQILPCISKYIKQLSDSVVARRQVSEEFTCDMEVGTIKLLSGLSTSIYDKINQLDEDLAKAGDSENTALELATYYRDVIFESMQTIRVLIDEAEANSSEEIWDMPTYGDLVFRV